MPPTFSKFASGVTSETAFDVLAKAKALIAGGKDVVELEIGDSPFPTTPAVVEKAIEAIHAGKTGYGPSAGTPEFRQAASGYVNDRFSLATTPENITAGPGAKTFEMFFCETFVNPGDGVLLFSPHFPTYVPNIERRGGRVVISALRQSHDFRPNLDDVEKFLREDASPKAIFLNSPHNPTGGIATEDDLRGLADLVRGRDVAIFSDEPYERMVWSGSHHTILAQREMFSQVVAAYTFSKSFNMGGWRLGFSVSSPPVAEMFAKLANSAISCVPPFTQAGGAAGLVHDLAESDRTTAIFKAKVEMLVAGLNQIDDLHCLMPGGAFYVFPSVAPICNRLGITSHGLAMYLLEGADEAFGVACLGGECFGAAGAGFLRFSCAQPDERIARAIDFLPKAFSRTDRVASFLERNPSFRLGEAYAVPGPSGPG